MEQRYCLITPAYNEEANLPRLVRSVTAQTIPPVLWVIVNDGSQDGTGRLLEELAREVPCVQPIHRTRDQSGTYYRRKIAAFEQGYRRVQETGAAYAFLGNLDADISMRPDYYESMLRAFSENPRLGIAGGAYAFDGTVHRPILHKNAIPGSILMFRRECFEAIGGYLPLPYGGEDTLACLMARVGGWETGFFPQHVVTQHRVVGTAENTGILKARFRQGLSEYELGYHPLFSFIKCLRRCLIERPRVVGSVARYLGYLCGAFVIKDSPCPPAARALLRKEQWQRIFPGQA